jgi:hypothetical protein
MESDVVNWWLLAGGVAMMVLLVFFAWREGNYDLE